MLSLSTPFIFFLSLSFILPPLSDPRHGREAEVCKHPEQRVGEHGAAKVSGPELSGPGEGRGDQEIRDAAGKAGARVTQIKKKKSQCVHLSSKKKKLIWCINLRPCPTADLSQSPGGQNH